MKKADSFYQLGRDYFEGNGFPQDTDMAIDYLLKAAKLNHLEAKILGADLLFKQSKNERSIYYEDGYRLSTELMVDVYRAGKLDITLPYLLNNKLFNDLCTIEELEEYYQEAYRLGYRETKYELAKLLFAKESFHSAEQWFLDSIKEDISKESHLYLYQIYCTKECYNEKKALVQLKEAMKYGFISTEFQEFIEHDDQILIQKKYYDSKFSEERIVSQINAIIKNCYYADEAFKKWFSTNKVTVRVYFDLELKLLNASYDLIHSDTETDGFMYEPVELSAGYFSDESDKKVTESEVISLSGKDSGFYQSQERPSYLELNLRDLFDQFNLKDRTPIVNTTLKDDELDQMMRLEINKDIKNKNKDKSKHQVIKVKKFNLYKAIVPSFDFIFRYNQQDYVSQRFAFDDKNWKPIFERESKDVDYKAYKLNLDFPLGKAVYDEIEQIKKEIPMYKRRVVFLNIVKSLMTVSLMWTVIIFIQNAFFMKSYRVNAYNIFDHILESPLWFVGGLIFFGLSYYLARIKIYAPIINNIRDKIIDNPAFMLPENTNKDHFKMQSLEVLLMVLLTAMFFLFSNFLSMI